MAASLVAATLANNTVVQALLDSLVERLLNRVSTEVPKAIEASIAKYAMDREDEQQRAMTRHHALLLNEVKQQHQGKGKGSGAVQHHDDSPSNSLYFCNSVLKLVDDRLKGLELLTMADLKVALSHLGDAKHALSRGNVKRFRFFIEESYLKSREALYKMGGRILYKIYVYSILCFDGFLLFSEFGADLRGGLLFIRKLLHEMQCDDTLNAKLTESLKSWRWSSFDKTLIAHSVLFGVKICALIRAIANRMTHDATCSMKKKENNQSTKDLKALFSEIEPNCTVLRQTEDEDEKFENDDILDLEGWIPDVWKVPTVRFDTLSTDRLCIHCVH